jgi:hypothetical protein
VNEEKLPSHPLDPYALTTGNLRRCATCVYLACEASVADDIAKKLRWAADEIESLRDQLEHRNAAPSPS